MNIVIRSEEKKDIKAIKKVNDLAFGQINEGAMVEKLRENPEFIPELSLVAVFDDEIVGHILFFPVKIKSELKNYTSLSLAPMAVLPDFQKKGIGTKLVNEGLKKARIFGFTSVIVVGHPKYYPKFGFMPASNWSLKLPFDIPDQVFMAIELKPDGLKDISGIVEYPKEYEEAM